MNLAEIQAELSGEALEWCDLPRRRTYRARRFRGVLIVEWLHRDVWARLSESDTETALRRMLERKEPSGTLRDIEDLRRLRAKGARPEDPVTPQEVRLCLDVAYSVRRADMERACTPTMADVFDVPRPLILGIRHENGIADWTDPDDPNRFGIFDRGRSRDASPEDAVRLIHMAVMEILSVAGWDEGQVAQLGRMYPRSGPYATGRTYRGYRSRVQQLARSAEKALIFYGLRRYEK